MKNLVIAGAIALAAVSAQAKDIIDTAAGEGNSKSLATALQAAGLVGKLKGKGPFAVVAPPDEVFAKAPKADFDALLKDKAKLTSPRVSRRRRQGPGQGQQARRGQDRAGQ